MASNTNVDKPTEELISVVMAMRQDRIEVLLEELGLPISGNKEAQRQRLETAALEGVVESAVLSSFLDRYEHLSRQHVFVYRVNGLAEFASPDTLETELRKADVASRLEEITAPALPEELTLSRVTHDSGQIEVQAVRRREHRERAPKLDRPARIINGVRVEFVAYVHYVTRTMSLLKWNPDAGTASLHLTMGQRGSDYYSQAEEEFMTLTSAWLPFQEHFTRLPLFTAVEKLATEETTGMPSSAARIRSQLMGVTDGRGRTMTVSSNDEAVAIFGDAAMTDSFNAVRKAHHAHRGSIHWLPTHPDATTISEEVHTRITAVESRVQFTAAVEEGAVDYVVEQLRRLS